MWEKLQEVFEELQIENGTVYARQGSFTELESIPDDLYSFWNISSDLSGFYNNKPNQCIWEWNICYYTTNAANLYKGLIDFTNKAKEKGFIIKSLGKDIPVDEPHFYGRYTTVQYIQVLTN